MKPRFILMTILAVALLVGGMAMMGGSGEALAGDAQSLQGAAAPSQPIILAEVTRGPATARATAKPTVKITVQAPRRGSSKTRGGYLMIAWTWYKNSASGPSTTWEPKHNFTITITKGRAMRDRRVVATLGFAGNSFTDGGSYNRTWRIPADFATGDDFIVKVRHSSGAAGMAGFFTIR